RPGRRPAGLTTAGVGRGPGPSLTIPGPLPGPAGQAGYGSGTGGHGGGVAVRDVVVVGAGHNALVAACYLARAGLDVGVVERATVPGGGVSAVERSPGYAVDRGSSAHIMIRHTGIVEELALAGCGLTYLDVDPWAFAPCRTAGGEPAAITFHADLDRTCA